jgi:hypothetical protein
MPSTSILWLPVRRIARRNETAQPPWAGSDQELQLKSRRSRQQQPLQASTPLGIAIDTHQAPDIVLCACFEL